MTTDRDPFAAAPPDLRELLALASDLALEAGRIHADGRRQALTIETKSSPTDLVSQIDKAAERLIVDRLRSERPDDAILGEEGTSREGTSGLRWVVDPLDGTTNYIYGYPAYSVSIAVEIDGERAGRRRPRLELGQAVPGRRPGRAPCATTGRSTRACPRTWRRPSSPPGSRTRRPSASSRARWWPPCCRASATSAAAGTRGARPLPPRRRRGRRLLGARPLAVGLRGRRADRPRGRRRGAAGAGRRRQGPAVVGAHPSLMPAFAALLREAGALT